LAWVADYIRSQYAKETLTNFSTNRAGRKVTSLISLCRYHYHTPRPNIPEIPLSD